MWSLSLFILSLVTTMARVIRGIRRQYSREARLLRPEELGRHACLAGE
jgi:hypothetical protein